MNIKINTHSSICINDNIYIDPFKIKTKSNNANIILITHSHWDHLEEESIKNIMNENTIFVCPYNCKSNLLEQNINEKNIILVSPNQTYNINTIEIKTFSSYNKNKPFHPKENNWVGYNINIDGIKYMICGDCDLTDELMQQSTNILFVPIGGTYTMDAIEGAKLANIIKPDVVIPMHYGEIVGDTNCTQTFIENLDANIKYKILI